MTRRSEADDTPTFGDGEDLSSTGSDEGALQKTSPRTDVVALRQQIRTLPAKARLDVILSCPDVIRVVRALPVQDLYATVRDVGPGDALELIELLHPRQVQGFLDLDGWRQDRVDTVAIGEWLEVLFAADPMRAATQLRGIDTELLTLLLKIHTQVYDLEQEESTEDDVGLHSVTPDHRYLVVYDRATGSEQLLLGLKTTVDLLFGKDLKYIMRLIQAVRWEVPSMLEEEAYRWRNARLGDLGFPSPEEAQQIFAWLDPDQDGQRKSEGAEPDAEPHVVDVEEDEPSTDLAASVLLPWDVLSAGKTVLAAAMRDMTPAVQDRVTHELMLTANHVHLAAGGDLGDPGALRETVERVADTVGVALSYAARGDKARVALVLGETAVRTLFRRGHSLGLRLQREMRARVKEPRCGLDDAGLLLLDSPLREVTAGILRRRPLFFVGLLEPARVEFRHFASLPEVAETARALTEAAFRATLAGPSGLGLSAASLSALGFADLSEVPPQGVLLATALARALLSEGDGLLASGPLDDEAFAALLALFTPEGRLDEAAEARALDLAAGLGVKVAPAPGASSPDEAKERARAYAKTALRAVEDELGAVVRAAGRGAADPRFVTTVWTVAALHGAREGKAEKEASALVSD